MFPKKYFDPAYFASYYFAPVENGGGTVYDESIEFQGQGTLSLSYKRIRMTRGAKFSGRRYDLSLSFRGSTHGGLDAQHNNDFLSLYFTGICYGSIEFDKRKTGQWRSNASATGSLCSSLIRTLSNVANPQKTLVTFDAQHRSTTTFSAKIGTQGQTQARQVQRLQFGTVAKAKVYLSGDVQEEIIFFAPTRTIWKHEATFYQQPQAHFINAL